MSQPDEIWANLKAVTQVASQEVLGLAKRQNRDWFDENDEAIQELLKVKRAAHQAHLTDKDSAQKKQFFHQTCSTSIFK